MIHISTRNNIDFPALDKLSSFGLPASVNPPPPVPVPVHQRVPINLRQVRSSNTHSQRSPTRDLSPVTTVTWLQRAETPFIRKPEELPENDPCVYLAAAWQSPIPTVEAVKASLLLPQLFDWGRRGSQSLQIGLDLKTCLQIWPTNVKNKPTFLNGFQHFHPDFEAELMFNPLSPEISPK